MVIEVLLACYNGEKYLPEQLESLSAQEGADLRVLMQDDGSADGTPALLQDWAAKDARFSVVQDERPQRVHGAIGNFWSLLGQGTIPPYAIRTTAGCPDACGTALPP